MSNGYNAGRIYVDVEINVKASKELDELKVKLEQTAKLMRELKEESSKLDKQLKGISKSTNDYKKSSDEINKALNTMNKREKELKKNLDSVKGQLQQQAKSLRDASISTENYSQSLHSALTAMKALILSAGAKRLAEALILPNAELESSIQSFEVLLGSYEKAQELTSALEDLAVETPLTSPDLIDAANRLLAVGIPLEEITDTIRMLGDLSLGSAEKLDKLVNAFGKITASGKGSLEYLNYFAEAGVPIFEALSTELNVSKEEFFKLTDAGKVMSEDVVNALKRMTSEGGRFYQMMEKQSKTAKGLFSTLEDELMILGRDIGAEAFEQLKDYLQDLLDTIDELRKTGELDEIIRDWGVAFADLVKFVGGTLKVLYEFRDAIEIIIRAMAGQKVIKSFVNSIYTLTLAFKSLPSAIKNSSLKITAFTTAFSLISIGVIEVIENLTKFKNEMESSNKIYDDLIEKSEKLVNSFNKQSSSIQQRIKQSNELLKTIRDLSNQEKLSVYEKEKLNEAIKSLNSSYEGLNLAYDEENGKLNRNISAVQSYITALNNLSGVQLNIQLVSNIDEQLSELITARDLALVELDKLKKEIEAPMDADFGLLKGLFDSVGVGTEFTALWNSIDGMEDKISDLMNLRQEYIEQGLSVAEAEDAVRKSFYELLTPAEKASDAIENLNSSISSIGSGTNSLINDFSNLTKILEKEGESIVLTREEADKLLQTYPELVNEIDKTSNGYEIERKALLALTIARLEEEKAAVDAEAEKSWQTVRETANRLGIYGTEIEAINSLAQAQIVMSRLSSSEAHKAFAEVLQVAIETQKVADATTARLEMLIDEFKSPIKISTSTKKGETEDEKLIRDLKFRLDMEYITYQEYYDRLEKIRDKYYANGTKQWQQYTLEITKGRKKLEEERKAAELAAYEKRLENSYNWIEDEQFYGRINDEEVIAGYERIKAYTKQYYKDGVIDYERYADEIRKIDKEIYSIQKENLETSMDDLSDLRKKKYNEAVKQVEDFYDALEKAEEDYDRRQEMKELMEEAELYEGAVTKTGKQRYKDLQDEINELLKEEKRIERETEKEDKLKQLEDAYNQLENAQIAYFETILDYSTDVTSRIQEMTKLIDATFSNITGMLGNVTTNNNNVTNNKTLIQNNTINDKASGQALIDLTAIKYRYSL